MRTFSHAMADITTRRLSPSKLLKNQLKVLEHGGLRKKGAHQGGVSGCEREETVYLSSPKINREIVSL